MKNRERHLSKRDRSILAFVARYRIGTDELLVRQCFAAGSSLKNVARVVLRLEKRGLLRKRQWGKGLAYVTLTPRGCRAIGLPSRTPRRLTEQSLPVVLAVASYCVRNGLERLTCREFSELYPELWRPGMRSSSYLLVQTPSGLKLEMIVVDRGGAARRVRSRVRRIIAQRSGLPDFVSLMESGRFRVQILTGTEEQQTKIRRQVEKQSFENVEVATTVVPELADILLLRT